MSPNRCPPSPRSIQGGLNETRPACLRTAVHHLPGHSGSHLRSIELVASGGADAAAIDSNALRLALRREPPLESQVRVMESWGPRPIQPLLARAGIPAAIRDRLLAALLTMHEEVAARRALSDFGVLRFTRVEESDYATFEVPRSEPVPRSVL